MSPLQQHAHDYVALRQALGHKMAHAVRLLPDFVGYLEARDLSTVTTDAALAWAQATPRHPAPMAERQRFAVARGFARFMSGIDPQTEIPPSDVLVYRYQRRAPYIFSGADIVALMAAVPRISRSPFRAVTWATLIGLLGITGMRVGEALRLTDHDVDWDQAVVVIRATKFGKSREIVLDSSTVSALKNYVAQRPPTAGPTPTLFVTEHGKPLAYRRVSEAFERLLGESGVGPPATEGRPHLHDLRHAFAVRTLIAWYREGVPVAAWLPRLSTYLGHVDPRDTYWYLTGVPELLHLAAQRVPTWWEEGRT